MAQRLDGRAGGMEGVPVVSTVLLVRHAVAKARHKWRGQDDALRPLTHRGNRQAAGLAGVLAPYAPARILTSRAVRCVDTISPLAAALAVPLEVAPELFEGERTAALDLIDGDSIALCSHGDVLPELLSALAGHLDTVTPESPFAKGSAWVLERNAAGKVASATYLAPPA